MRGLSEHEAEMRLGEFGRNVLVVKNPNPWWKIFLRQFTDALIVALLVAAVISFFVGDAMEVIVILGIVGLNGMIGFYQEYRTERTLQAFKKMIIPEIRVIRDGIEYMLSTDLLVPGDIVVLGEGDKIPADGVLQVIHSLRVEESALTGESIPVHKRVKEKVWMGTAVVHGSGIFRVKRTGMNTHFGEIVHLTASMKPVLSPLQKELRHIGIWTTKATLAIAVLLVGVGMLRGTDFLESLIFSVSVAIAAIPQGLPTTLTVALALGAGVLMQKKAIVKRLNSVETLGAVTTICSDKTGTLTQNEMTVKELYLPDRSIYEATGTGYDPGTGGVYFIGGSKGPGKGENMPLLEKLLRVCKNCNEAKLIKHDGVYTVLGDPTEGALLTLVQKYRKPLGYRVRDIFPFDTERKMMSVLTDQNVMVKGSPDAVLARCTHWHDGVKRHKMTSAKMKHIKEHYARMAEEALRVLAFAERDVRANEKVENEEKAERGLTFVGLVGMIDPPREEVYDSVQKCQTAGIRIVVITGDYGVTAAAIARDLGIVPEGKKVQVYTGKDVKKMTDKKLLGILKKRNVPLIFARSLPEQKMRIVSLLQDLDEVVAMTGDGVNDAPALKKADIGVAMGISGTEVSKEAATMILTDDSFSSIVTAVEEGRRIYDNLKKFVYYIYSSNIGELVMVFLAILFGFPLPLTAILILCVDMGTDILPGISLGMDVAEKDIMKQAPRSPHYRVMNWGFVRNFLYMGGMLGLASVFAFLWTLDGDGWEWGSLGGEYGHSMTVAFVVVVLGQFINSFAARSMTKSLLQMNPLENPFQLISIVGSTVLLLAIVYLPTANLWLGTVPLNGQDWATVGVACLVPHVLYELRKMLARWGWVAVS